MAQGARPRLHISAHYQDSSSSDENSSENVFLRNHHRHSRTSLHRISPPTITTTSSGAIVTTTSDSISRRPSMTASITPCQAVPPSRRHSIAVTASTNLRAAGLGEDWEWRRRLEEQILSLQISLRYLEEQNKTPAFQRENRQQQWCDKETGGDKSTGSATVAILGSSQLSVIAAVVATIACTGMLGYCLGMSARMK